MANRTNHSAATKELWRRIDELTLENAHLRNEATKLIAQRDAYHKCIETLAYVTGIVSTELDGIKDIAELAQLITQSRLSVEP